LSPAGRFSEKLAASGMCLGPKDPGDNNPINQGLVRLHVAERKRKKRRT
jgi:hypothetical protein